MTTLFISDLHLDPARPTITALFLAFLKQRAARAEALYLLGDLFEVWIGDDDDSALGREVAAALRHLTEKGITVFFIHGNRDFLIGDGFAEASGIQLLPETHIIDLFGEPTLIMHGDTLCTDDVAYQAWRARARSPQWQAQVLGMPLAQRRNMAKELRLDSETATGKKSQTMMDVNQNHVVQTMREYRVRRLIHGHTHRPAIHNFDIDGESAQRIVLGDWGNEGSALFWNRLGPRLDRLSLRAADFDGT